VVAVEVAVMPLAEAAEVLVGRITLLLPRDKVILL
jgi:hypothetical protein